MSRRSDGWLVAHAPLAADQPPASQQQHSINTRLVRVGAPTSAMVLRETAGCVRRAYLDSLAEHRGNAYGICTAFLYITALFAPTALSTFSPHISHKQSQAAKATAAATHIEHVNVQDVPIAYNRRDHNLKTI